MSALQPGSAQNPREIILLHHGFCPVAQGEAVQIKFHGKAVDAALLERLNHALEDCLVSEGYEIAV